MREIAEDLIWYGSVYKNVKNKYDMNNGEPDVVAKALIQRFDLKRLCARDQKKLSLLQRLQKTGENCMSELQKSLTRGTV